MIPLDKFVVSSNKLIWRILDDEAILLSEDGTNLHMLNDVGTFIWKIADGNLTINDIIARLCDEFDVEEDIAKSDALEFIQKLVDKGIFQIRDRAIASIATKVSE